MFRQPKPFYVIFFVELWERFGYYGMVSIVVYYMVKKMGMHDAEAFNVFGAFTALSYVFVCIGGYIGDNILGAKRTLILGALVLAVGYFMMSTSRADLVLPAMSVIAIGSGLFKANPSNLLAKCYEKNDPRLDGAFTMYYMSVNIGSFLSMTLIPVVSDHYGYGAGFFICGIGLLLAVINFLMCYKWLSHVATKAGKERMQFKHLGLVIIGSLVLMAGAYLLLKNLFVAHLIMFSFGGLVLLLYLYFIANAKGLERKHLTLALILIFCGMVFFILYQQMQTSINFFTINNVRHSILGFSVNPLTFQAADPFWILIMSPVLAYFYNHYGHKGRDLSMPAKFTVGMLLCSFAFLSLYLSQYFADASGNVSSGWIIFCYFFQGTGELMVSGLGLAMISRFVPQHLTGFLMGSWFLASAISMMLGGFAAGLTSIPSNIPVGVFSLHIYTDYFLKVGLLTLLVTFLMWLGLPKMRKLMVE